MAGLVQTIPPTFKPVTVGQMTAALRLDTDDEKEFLEDLIDGVTNETEVFLGRQLAECGYALNLDEFPADGKWIELPMPPLTSVTSVDYYDPAGNLLAVANSAYEYDGGRAPGVIRLKEGQSWPATKRQFDAVNINYLAGWNLAEKIPAAIRLAIRDLVAHHFTHREPILTGTIQAKLSYKIDRALAMYRVAWPTGLGWLERTFVEPD